MKGGRTCPLLSSPPPQNPNIFLRSVRIFCTVGAKNHLDGSPVNGEEEGLNLR